MNKENESGLLFEACVEGVEEAISAEAKGAHRIELCADLQSGGTTPSIGIIREVMARLTIPVFVMIRPRGGNFVYTPAEMEVMKRDIMACRQEGVPGVVLGMLDEQHSIQLDQLYNLVELARPMEITFHKAIDTSWNIPYELGRLRDAGIHRVLTSGGAETAFQGASTLNEMIRIAGEKMKIVVAGKVTCDNVLDLAAMIPATEFHGRKIVGNL